MVIGITGKSGVGKSTIAKETLVPSFNAFYLDVDSVGHTVLDDPEVKAKIKEAFGIDVSSTNRKELGNLVFSNRHNMKELSDITYAKMKEIIYNVIETNKNVVIDWILLPHTEFFDLCDVKYLVVPADEEQRAEMVMKRDGITREELELRDKASIEYNREDYNQVLVQRYK